MSELQKLREAKSRAETFDQAIAWAQSNCEVLSSIENTKNGDASSPSANPNQRLMTLSDAARDLYDVVVTANGSNGTTAAAAATSAATKYLVATQDEDLLDALRTASVVPILRIARGSVLLLEQPSVYAKTRSRNEEKQKWTKKDTLMTSKEQQLVELVVRERQKQNTTKRPAADGPISNHVVQQQRKKTKAKGPNPLSCKKRKQTERQTPSKETKDDEENGRKRRRRRKNAKETSTDPSQNA
jgi:rRNA-processing protein FCF1